MLRLCIDEIAGPASMSWWKSKRKFTKELEREVGKAFGTEKIKTQRYAKRCIRIHVGKKRISKLSIERKTMTS